MRVILRYILMLTISLCAVGCYEVLISETTHPFTSEVDVEITLPTLYPDDATIPGSFVVEIDGNQYVVDENGVVVLPDYFEVGEYLLCVYSESDGVECSEGVASIEVDSDGYLRYDPQIFFFGSTTISVGADGVVLCEVEVEQITGELNFNLEIVDGDPDVIVEAKATLSGLAAQWDCLAGAPSGDAATMAPPITQGAALVRSGVDNDHLTSSVYMMGTNGEEQILTITLTLANGAEAIIPNDISALLTSFNSDKATALTISANISIPESVDVEDPIVMVDWEVSNTILGGDTN